LSIELRELLACHWLALPSADKSAFSGASDVKNVRTDDQQSDRTDERRPPSRHLDNPAPVSRTCSAARSRAGKTWLKAGTNRGIKAIGQLIVEFCDSAIHFAYPPDNVPDEDEPKSAIDELHHVFFVS